MYLKKKIKAEIITRLIELKFIKQQSGKYHRGHEIRQLEKIIAYLLGHKKYKDIPHHHITTQIDMFETKK